ncbi:hypothetical protein EVAR_78619_1 [Eumeta japonica]|uniref:Uncharacterized protein n=1 Tax=Eumeta variegata TaxID=151549 RepID=A0A4C1U7Q3_EUMVA|nr:hypothetical protein EVAR_78619_1 [Eumeta japonica]
MVERRNELVEFSSVLQREGPNRPRIAAVVTVRPRMGVPSVCDAFALNDLSLLRISEASVYRFTVRYRRTVNRSCVFPRSRVFAR